MERWGEIEVKFLARKCVQMKREQADKSCTDGVGGWLGELECRLSLPHRETLGLTVHSNVHQCRQVHMSAQVLLHSFSFWPLLSAQTANKRPSVSTLLLNTACITHRHAQWWFSFALYYLWYQFLHWEHQPSGYKIDFFFFCAIQRKMCQIKYKRHLREQG